MNIASIDIGSNTVLLLVAEIDYNNKILKPIINKYEAPRLGKGLSKDGNILNESIQKLYTILADYKLLVEQYKCSKIICTATNAMRIANNSSEILKEVENKFKIDIEIISGDREAELTYLGASTVLNDEKSKVVIDIGGGSTEIIYGRNDNMIYKKSFPIGAINLTEKFIKRIIPTKKEIHELSAHIHADFNQLNEIIPNGTPLIAVAGTPTSLSAINLGLREYDEKIIEGSELTIKDIEQFINDFSSTSPQEILDRHGELIKGREDVILSGCLILKTLMDILKSKKLIVSSRGIRYGSVIDFINNS